MLYPTPTYYGLSLQPVPAELNNYKTSSPPADAVHPFTFERDIFSQQNFVEPGEEFCSLQNENLFTIDKLIFLRAVDTETAAVVYRSIEPALKLVSRLILDNPEALGGFLDSRCKVSGKSAFYLDEPLYRSEAIRRIRVALPDIDIGRDIYVRGEPIGFTNILPGQLRDTIVLDDSLVEIQRSKVKDTQKTAALVLLAVLIGHGLAHSLVFRYIHQKKLDENRNVYDDRSNMPFGEAGCTWELQALGGKIRPICDKYEDLRSLHGLSMQSNDWNSNYMKLDERWLRGLFQENHWFIATPLLPPPSVIAQQPLIHDPLLDDTVAYDLFVKRRQNNADLKINYSPAPELKASHKYCCNGRKVFSRYKNNNS